MEIKICKDPKSLGQFVSREAETKINQAITKKGFAKAPELPGALEFGKILTKKGIIASIAYTEALFSDVQEARKVGFSLMTHLYSAMLGNSY